MPIQGATYLPFQKICLVLACVDNVVGISGAEQTLH